ncbi:MAG: formimidoylglutamase [Chitinophagales bacterium]|nr:formimidoylglutamase [Chitinophagales bacterium]MCZ2393720.1 formimidoylglutamase [Chitinophagales bacterium]
MLTDYIQPIYSEDYQVQGKPIYFYTGNDDELENFKIAIIGVLDYRGHIENCGCELGPNSIRKQLYQLHHFEVQLPIIDLGNILPGEKFSDTLVALKEVVKVLNSKNIISIVLGGDMSITLGQYQGLCQQDRPIDLVVVDERIVISEPKEDAETHESNYLYKIFTERPNHINDFKLLGYQTYFNHGRDIDILEEMQMGAFRLGELRDDMMSAEPLIRDADMLSFNISAIKSSDAPGYILANPNGFFSDEACQIMRFAGASDKLSSIGIYNYNPELDNRNITSIGIAQMIWYFIEGISIRKQDYPIVSEKNFQKFIINLESSVNEIIFLKSKKSDRWWFHIPIINTGNTKKKIYKMIPCSYSDYLTAVNNEIPEKWEKAFSRYN